MYITEEMKTAIGKVDYKLDRDEMIWIWKQAEKYGLDRFDTVTAVKYCLDNLLEFKSVREAYNIWGIDNYV